MVQRTNSYDALDLKNQVECSLNALLELRKSFQKKRLLIDNGEYIFLQVCIFKIPELDEFIKRRILLKNPVWAGVPEVCLIVRDFIMRDGIKRTTDEMIDITVEKYEELLKKQKINGITNVMPYEQLKKEYNTYELKRKLVNRFDTFLCDSYLHSRDNYFNCLGKIFIESNKYPIAVKLPKLKADYDPSANKQIMSAIASTVFYIRPSSDNYSIRVGNTLNEKEKIIENVNTVIDKILNSDDLIPGGFKNIQAIHIKTEKSKAIPIYISLSERNDIPIPVVKSNVPVLESVEGEISTLPGRKVTVLPTGDVFVTDMRKRKTKFGNKSKAKEDKTEREEEEGCKNKKPPRKASKKKDEKLQVKKESLKKKKKSSNTKNEDEFDLEDAIESAEQKYLLKLNDEIESNDDETQRIKKKGTKRKLKDDSKAVKKAKKEKILKTKVKRNSLKKTKDITKLKKVK